MSFINKQKKLTNTERACEAYVLHEKILRLHLKKPISMGKNWLFCSLLSAYIVCPLRSSLMTRKSNKGTPRRTSFPVFKLCRAVFWQNRQKLFINSPRLPQINGMLWLLRKSSLFSGGWGGGGGGGGLFHSILFQGCNHKGYNLDPLPPQKNIYI